MAWTAEDVIADAASDGVSLTAGIENHPGETEQSRAQRIADELNSGDRTSAEWQNSKKYLLNEYGNTAGNAAETVAGETGALPGDSEIRLPGTDPKLDREEQRREMELVYSWLPSAAVDVWIKEWIESGNTDAAWATVRKSDQYQYWFPGNLTDDGRVRYSEEDYAAVTASYDDVFRAVGLNPDNFQGRYGELIEGEVAPDELAKNRVMPMYERIVEGSTAIKKWYSDNYGLELTTEALLASSLDPDLGQKILNRQIGMAEIGGEAQESGFGLAEGFVDRLYEAGLNREQADQMFQNAEAFVPVLNTLAARHADVDDDFDLEEFVSADLFGDPTQRSRMRRLVAQERSTFSGGQLGAGAAQSRTTGGLTGLTER